MDCAGLQHMGTWLIRMSEMLLLQFHGKEGSEGQLQVHFSEDES